MADDTSNRGAQDRAQININEEHEVRYWTEALDFQKKRYGKRWPPSASVSTRCASDAPEVEGESEGFPDQRPLARLAPV